MALIEQFSTDERSRFMPLADVLASTEFLQLNRAQKNFVTKYLGDGFSTGIYDAAAAAVHAYGKGGTLKNPHIRGHQLLATRTIRRVLDLHFKRDGQQDILDDIRRLIPLLSRRLAKFENLVREHTRGAALL